MVGDTLCLHRWRASALVPSDCSLWASFTAAIDSPFDARWSLVRRGLRRVVDNKRRIFIAPVRVSAIDAAGSRPMPAFGTGFGGLAEGLRWPADSHHVRSTSAPVIAGDLVIVGSAIPDRLIHDRDPPGALLAFDVRSGARRWAWHSVPASGEPGSETWESGATERVGHANIWSPMTVDTARARLPT
jgi:glucose dehydrogenase